jgi:hypothetical protein
MVGSSYSVAERRAGVEAARPNFTSAIDAEDPATEPSATGRTASAVHDIPCGSTLASACGAVDRTLLHSPEAVA